MNTVAARSACDDDGCNVALFRTNREMYWSIRMSCLMSKKKELIKKSNQPPSQQQRSVRALGK